MSAINAHFDDGPDWLDDEGGPPTAAEIAIADRVEFIGDELDRAARYPADAAYYISGALDSARNHGTMSIVERQRDCLLLAISRARPAVVAALPQFSYARILDALDALAELADLCANSERLFGEAAQAEDCRARMRIGQNEAHNLSLMGSILAGKLSASLRNLQRIAANEVENLTLGADEAGRQRRGRQRAA